MAVGTFGLDMDNQHGRFPGNVQRKNVIRVSEGAVLHVNRRNLRDSCIGWRGITDNEEEIDQSKILFERFCISNNIASLFKFNVFSSSSYLALKEGHPAPPS